MSCAGEMEKIMDTTQATMEAIMDRQEAMEERERVIAQLYWEQQIPGKLRADLALLLWNTVAEARERGTTMEEILEATDGGSLSLREKPEVKTGSKVNLSARNAMRSLISQGLIERRGFRYYEIAG